MSHRSPTVHLTQRVTSALDRFRADKDRFFATDPHSPLTGQQRIDFCGLSYFPENPALRQEISIAPLADAPYERVLPGCDLCMALFNSVLFAVE